MLIGLGQLATFFAAPVHSARLALRRIAPVTAATAVATSLLLASCGTDQEPATATTTSTQSDDADSDASRRAKAMQSTGTKSNNDLLRTVESTAD